MSSRKTRSAASRRAAEPPPRPAARSISGRWVVIALLLLGMALFVVLRYTRKSALAHANSAQQQASPTPAAAQSDIAQPAPTAPRIDAARAMSYVREVAGLGPRFIGSPGHKKTEAYIHTHLKGVEVSDDNFTATTPAGPLAMR